MGASMVDSARFAALGKDGPAEMDNDAPFPGARAVMAPPQPAERFSTDSLPAEILAAVAGKPTTLFDLGQMDVRWDAPAGTLWAYLTPQDRPNCNLGLLKDTMSWQQETRRLFGPAPSASNY